MSKYVHKSPYFYGNKISDYGLENGYVDYATLSKAFDAVLVNDITKLFFADINGEFNEPEQVNGLIDNQNEIDKLPYIQIFADGPKHISFQNRQLEKPLTSADLNEFGYYPVYVIGLVFTSRRSIPKNLVYLGNYPTLTMPKGEVVYTNTVTIPAAGPKAATIEDKIVNRYLHYHLRKA